MQTDISEVDGKLVALARGCPEVATIDIDDLGAHEWRGHEQPVPRSTSHLAHELELPAQYELTYFEPSRAYENNTQRAIRTSHTGYVQEIAHLQAPIVLSANGARRAAERLLHQQWQERASVQFSVGPKYLALVAGSPVTVPLGGAGTEVPNRLRIHSIDMALPGELRCAALLDASFVLDQDAEGDDTVSFGAAFTPPPIVPGGPSLDLRVPGNTMYLPGL